MRKLLVLIAILFCAAVGAHAQGVSVNDTATVNIGGVLRVVPLATITVCTAGTSGLPCITPITTCKDIALSMGCAAFQTADINGNFSYFVASGCYQETQTASGVTGISLVRCAGGATGGGITGCTAGNVVVAGSASSGGCSPAIPAVDVAQMTFDPLKYGAIADGSTNNSTAITNAVAALNAITSGYATLHFGCQVGQQCQYNYTDGGGTSPIHPIKASTIQCDPGVTLNDTGSAHMMDLGDGTTGYTIAQPFNVLGCRFISTGTVTAGVFLNSGSGYIETGHIDNNVFDGLPSGSTAILETAGQFSNMYVEGNQFRGQGSFLNLGNAVNDIVTARGNLLACVDSMGSRCSGLGGVGIQDGGEGSIITDNTIVWFDPLIRVTQAGLFSHIGGNNLESNISSSGAAIQFGISGDSTGTVDGVVIDNNYVNMHSSAPFIGPSSGSSASTTLISWNVHDNRFQGGPSAAMVVENPVTGQRYNQANGNWTLSFGNWWTNTLQLVTANAITPEPWFQTDSNSYSDTFQRADGALGGAWITISTQTALAITSHVVTCSATCAGGLYSNDISTNQRNSIRFGTVPTGTDFVGVYARFTQSGASAFSNYQCFYQSGTGIKMVAVVAGSATQLGSTYTTVTPVAGDTLTLESIGTEQTCYLRHTTAGVPGPDIAVVGPVADATVAAGYGGMQIGGTTGTISLFTEIGLP
jgi:hypothetical protein